MSDFLLSLVGLSSILLCIVRLDKQLRRLVLFSLTACSRLGYSAFVVASVGWGNRGLELPTYKNGYVLVGFLAFSGG